MHRPCKYRSLDSTIPRSRRADGIAALVEVWRVEKYRFTPTAHEEAYLKYARESRAMAEWRRRKATPPGFRAWVDHDPPIATDGIQHTAGAAKVLLMLYSLEQDFRAQGRPHAVHAASRWPRQW